MSFISDSYGPVATCLFPHRGREGGSALVQGKGLESILDTIREARVEK